MLLLTAQPRNKAPSLPSLQCPPCFTGHLQPQSEPAASVAQPKQGQQAWGTLVGAVRLGERASIGFGTWTSAHGGAIESVLDEATAELAKMEWATMVSTIEVRGVAQVVMHACVCIRTHFLKRVQCFLRSLCCMNFE